MAYEVLSDPERRQQYDMYGDAAVSGAGGGDPFGGAGFGDIFDAFFGGGGSPFGGAAQVADNGARRARPGVPTSNRPSTSTSPRRCSGSRRRDGAHRRGL